MRSPLLPICALAGAAAAQQPFPPIRGFDVGFNPNAFVAATTLGGQFGIVILNPGGDYIMSFHDRAFLPAGTVAVTLDLQLWGVLENNACAVGAGLFIDTHSPQSTFPVASVVNTGWNLLTAPWAFQYVSTAFHSTWQVTYCGVVQCTSPCSPSHHDPEWEAYFLTLR